MFWVKMSLGIEIQYLPGQAQDSKVHHLRELAKGASLKVKREVGFEIHE